MKTYPPEEAGISSPRLNRIGMWLSSYVDHNKLAGALVMLARDGKVVYSECCGMMDIAASKPMQLDTIFRIYSLAKSITSVAFMKLYEEGYLQLDDSVSKFLPYLMIRMMYGLNLVIDISA